MVILSRCLFVFLLSAMGSRSYAVGANRRDALKFSISGLVGLVMPKPAPPVDIAVSELAVAAPAMASAEFQAAMRVRSLDFATAFFPQSMGFSLDYFEGVDHRYRPSRQPENPRQVVAPLKIFDMDIIADWMSAHPESSSQVQKLLDSIWDMQDYRDIMEVRFQIHSITNNGIWSNWHWQSIFKERLLQAEADVANELGVPVGDLSIAIKLALEQNKEFMLRNVLRDKSTYAATPIYSKKVLDSYISKIEKFVPYFAQHLKQINSSGMTTRGFFASMSGVRVEPAMGRYDAFRFMIGNRYVHSYSDKEGSVGHIDSKTLALEYVEALKNLAGHRDKMASFDESPLRSEALSIIDQLTHDLEYELSTLPQRLEYQFNLNNLRNDTYYLGDPKDAVHPTEEQWADRKPTSQQRDSANPIDWFQILKEMGVVFKSAETMGRLANAIALAVPCAEILGGDNLHPTAVAFDGSVHSPLQLSAPQVGVELHFNEEVSVEVP